MKKKISKLLPLGMAAILLLATASGCSSSAPAEAAPGSANSSNEAGSAESGDIQGALKGVTLKIGTSGLFAPFTYYDNDGKTLIGYDIDLVNDIQKILGFNLDGENLQAMDYSALTTSVAEGKLDVVAAALCTTDKRKKVMDFTQTYYNSSAVILINKENSKGITGLEDLGGKTIGLEKGTASHIFAQKNLPDSTFQIHDTITTAYESLEQKKVDAVIQERPSAAFYIKTTTDTKLEIVGDDFNKGQAQYAIALSKDSKYTDYFNKAMDQLKEDGTLDQLYDKWLK